MRLLGEALERGCLVRPWNEAADLMTGTTSLVEGCQQVV